MKHNQMNNKVMHIYANLDTEVSEFILTIFCHQVLAIISSPNYQHFLSVLSVIGVFSVMLPIQTTVSKQSIVLEESNLLWLTMVY